MAAYYNKTRGPVSFSLSNGEAMCIGSKKWATLQSVDEGSPGLIDLLRKGFLVKSKIDNSVPEVVAAPVLDPVAAMPAPVTHSAPVSVEPPKTVATPAVEPTVILGTKANRKGR